MVKPVIKRKLTNTVVPRHTEMKNFEDGFQESDDPLSSSSQEFTVYPEPEPKLISHVKHTKKRKSQPVERISYNEIEKKEYDEKRAKKIRKSEPVTWKKTDTDEYEEDIGRNESMDTLDIAESRLVDIEQRKKKKAAKENAIYLESFKLLLMHGEEQITKQLKDRGNAALKTDTTFLRAFRSTYTKTSPFQDTKSGKKLGGFAAVHEKSLELIADANELVKTFEAIEQRIAELDMMGILVNEWVDEERKIEVLLDEGRQVGIAKYREILVAKGGDVQEEGDSAQFYSRERLVEGATGAWGEVARKQEKAIRRLVNSIVVSA